MTTDLQLTQQLPSDSSIPIACPACGALARSAPIEHLAAFSLYPCSSCDLHFWHPRKMPDGRWYELMYGSRDAGLLPLEPGHKYFFADPLAPKSGRLLDVGCGTGNFLLASRSAGFEVTGTEQRKGTYLYVLARVSGE